MHPRCIQVGSHATQLGSILWRLTNAHIGTASTGGRQVRVLDIVNHHTVSTKSRGASCDRFDHSFDPLAWQAIQVAIVEERYDFVTEYVQEIFNISRVSNFIVDVLVAITDCKSILAIECLGPPAVEY